MTEMIDCGLFSFDWLIHNSWNFIVPLRGQKLTTTAALELREAQWLAQGHFSRQDACWTWTFNFRASKLKNVSPSICFQTPVSLKLNVIEAKVRKVSLHSLRSNRRPNRLWSLAVVLQFQRWLRNWCWHSEIQSFIPAPMACITFGCWRHSWRCLFTRPGMLSHITWEPRVPMYLPSGGADTR